MRWYDNMAALADPCLCSMYLPYVPHVICIFVILVMSHFGFEGRIFVLVVPPSGHCLFLVLQQDLS